MNGEEKGKYTDNRIINASFGHNAKMLLTEINKTAFVVWNSIVVSGS